MSRNTSIRPRRLNRCAREKPLTQLRCQQNTLSGYVRVTQPSSVSHLSSNRNPRLALSTPRSYPLLDAMLERAVGSSACVPSIRRACAPHLAPTSTDEIFVTCMLRKRNGNLGYLVLVAVLVVIKFRQSPLYSYK
ncbi:hypothetical protein EXIGLDRAFT_728118 [Exidia glandulosa HHB12029]|uniref:Uncharacterized protein n=1 Tax=Exidia glandulosa HHB12029 TaxID=1314781 RepID=A0A165LVK4_EXIGL|nr:hypothetical protein EXIGLDRAFT_728118 [Exidia glandulosa HHB12029]